MSLPGFYNDNTGRSYPLVPFFNVTYGTQAPEIPPLDTLVDFGCMVGLDAEFDSGEHSVHLHEIRRAGNKFKFDFRSDAPGLAGYALVFSRDLADVEYTTDYVGATLITGSGVPQDTLWEGFLVTGSLDSLAALMPADGVVTIANSPQIEPSLVQNLGRSYLRTINLANQNRTLATPPADCPGGSDNPNAEYTYTVNARDLAGDPRFKEGYNVSIRQNVRSNSLTFASISGAGDGVPCGEVPLSTDESSPDGGSLLTGGPACDELISSVNGLTASVIRLVADLGTTIVPAPPDTPNTLIVDFDRNDMTVCGAIATVVEELPDA